MATDLGLSEYYQSVILNYMRFARYQRSQSLRAVSAFFQDIKDARLLEDTYTLNEIDEILEDLASTVRCEVESELINSAHMNALLLRQFFSQAQQWHLKLEADTSELENRELLEQIRSFEEQENLSSQKEKLSSPVKTKLEPITESGSTLLQAEISRLKEENETLRGRMKNLESQAITFLQEKSKLNDVISKMEKEQQSSTSQVENTDALREKDSAELQQKLNDLQAQLEGRNMLLSNQETLENDLVSIKKRFLEAKEQLELVEKELEKKFSQTSAYTNLKKMLNKKNEQIKELRKKLAMYDADGQEEESSRLDQATE